MCGICGIFNINRTAVDRELLTKMNYTMIHRGPDGEGQFIDNEVGLGHRRLSIIDLEGGAQPIGNEDGSLQIVFNGEIYNFIELREQLKASGHIFKTSSDTEVIVHAYEEWGVKCVESFNGIFAFALWDSHRRELFIARDHLGIKPLYYIQLGNRVLFASEIKALLQDHECTHEVSIEALSELFTYRYVPSPKTLFKNIMKLPPGHKMILSEHGIEISRFWNWVPRIRENYDEIALIEEYQYLLEDSVRMQMRSDVPLGLFLSEGIDSGALLAIMSEHSSRPIQTFTIGFEGGEKTNEVNAAYNLARKFGAKHDFMMVTPQDYLDYYDKYIWDIEEPVGNETAAAFYFVSKLAKEKVKVVLSGQGADEPWAGYDRYLGVKLSKIYSRIPQAITEPLAAIITKMPGRFERLKRGVVSLSESDMLTRFSKIYSFFSDEMKQQLFAGKLKDQIIDNPYGAKHALQRLQADVRHMDPLTQILYIDTRASLPDDLLMVGDKTSMTNSLESRVPYLDYRLIEYIESLPPSLKLKWLTGKYLHKKALTKWLPNNVINRKKKGFANPIEDWFRNKMKPFVEELLLASDSAVANYFNQKCIRDMLRLDCEGKEQFSRHIYLLVSFEMWHRSFIGK